MLRKALTICLLYYAVAVGIAGCCNCSGVQEFRYKWTGIKSSTGAYSTDGAALTVSDDSITDYAGKSLMLLIRYDYELIAAGKAGHGLIGEAIACKCGEQYHLLHRFTDIRITTVYDFDATHPAMSEVSDYFKAAQYSDHGVFMDFVPRSAILEATTDDVHRISDSHRLFLTQRLTPGTKQQFQLRLTLDDGSFFTTQTSTLQF